MKSKCPIKDNIAYLANRALRAESAIFRCGCGSFGALEQHPPGSFVRCVEEPAQGSVLGRIKLPQVASPALAWQDAASEHHLDHIDKLDVIVHHALDARLECSQLV